MAIGIDNPAHKFMPDDVGFVEVHKVNPGDIVQDFLGMHQSAGLVFRQVNLGDVACNNEFCCCTHACEKHFQLAGSCILSFIENRESIVECSSPHKGQWRDLDHTFFNLLKEFLGWQHVAQGII